MLVTLKEILKYAEKYKKAIGSFNTPNVQSIHAVIGAAEELNQPVIIMHAQLHEDEGHVKMEEIAPIMLFFAKRAKVPVCVHLDHGTDVDYVKKGIDLGFTGIMYDGSLLDEETNTKNTIEIVEYAKKTGASVEAEIGSMGTREDGTAQGESIYTDPDAAVRFVKATGIDALACAFGTAHGFYKEKPKLDFERLSKISSLVDMPIVMHGGSGVSPEDYVEVINRGVRKINYYSYMARAGLRGVEGKKYDFFHELLTDGEKAMQENAKEAIKTFSMCR